MLNPNRIPVPLPHEMTVTTVDSGVEISLMIPTTTTGSTSSAAGGSSGGIKRFKANGKLYLTDQRFIFISDSSTFDSLSVPLHAVLSTRFEQPTFGANFLSFEIKPSPEGGLNDGTQVELRFRDRAMFEFVSLLEKSRERAIYMKRQGADDDEGLPSYTTPAESSTVTLVGGVPVDNPPSYD